jgi:cholesterol transport system auxiliary component
MMRPVLFFVIAVLFFAGCAGTSNYYVLSGPSTPERIYQKRAMSIGVEEISVPKYLFKREIAVAKSSHKIVFLSHAQWAEDLNDGLTRRLVGYLQHAFNNPNVHLYPWGVESQPRLRVKVAIMRFIAEGDRVYLDASWSIDDLKYGRKKSGLFSTSVPTEQDPESVVTAMDKAFSQLEAEVAGSIKAF